MHPSPLSLRSVIAACVALVAVPVTAQTYGSDDQALAFFDTMCCQAGDTPIDQHTPEIGARWTVEGTASDGLKPKITSSKVNFEPGSNAVAVGSGPTGERTLRAVVWEPNSHAADVTLYLIDRYLDAQTFAALRLRWTPNGTTVAVDAIAVTGGAVTTSVGLGALPVADHSRRVPVEVESTPTTNGHTWTVHVDGVLLPGPTVPGFVGVGAFALAAEAPIHPNPDGYHARVEDVAVLVPSTPIGVICDGLRGWNAESCLRAEYAPVQTFHYDEARDHLFETVWVESVRQVGSITLHDLSGLYGGLVRSWEREVPLSPRAQMQDQDFNTEHVWPRSRGAQTGPSTDGASHNDLHHIAPAFGTFNSARSNRAFGDDFDQPSDTQKWLRNSTVRYNASGPPTDPATWSRVEFDFLRQPDDGDGYKSLDELGRFDVRHAFRGDVARMAAYFLVTYRIEAEDGDEGRAFIDATLDVLRDWHEADPVDAFEVQRNERIYRAQGNRNPFVLDPTLVARTFYQGPNAPRPRDLWINEIHHSNDGPDAFEGIEIAGRAGTDLYGYRVWTYSGYGFLYQVDGDGTDGSPAVAFRGTIDDEGGGIGAVWQGAERLRGGCQGLALTDPDGVLLQFLSTGGCMFNAIEGPVFDAAEAASPGGGLPSHPDSLAWSTVIRGPRQPSGTHRRVQEWSELPPGHSLQLTGSGDAYTDFSWTGPLPETRGRMNDYQAPSALRSGAPRAGTRAANAVSGWASGDPIPLGLLAPAVDTGHDEDRPSLGPSSGPDGGEGEIDSPRLGPEADAADGLTVSSPSPNPARTSTRLRITAPPGTHVEATVFDALGRAVARHDDIAGDLRLDVSSLAAGVYVVRLTASSGGTTASDTRLGAQVVTHRLTVVR